MQRRRLLQLGLASAAVLSLAGGAVAAFRPGLLGGRLSLAGRSVLEAVGRAVLDGSLPAAGPERARALQGLLERIDALTTVLPPHAQEELSQLLGLLDTAAGRMGLSGLRPTWLDAEVAQVQQALQGMRTSSLALRQQAYQALHDIVGGAYFSDPATWAHLGYPGPLAL